MFYNFEDLLNVEEACEMLRMSRNSLYVLLKNGDVKGYQQGRIWKIPKQAIIEYISKRSGISLQS